MAKQMCVCRIERVSGDGGGLGTETKRQYSDGRDYSPNNVTKERTHLNRQIVGKGDAALRGGDYIVSAINRRIEGANLRRKVGSNQCRALIAYLSGTHDQMIELVNQGKLDDWVKANVKWLNQTFGADNVVSVDLHLDEYTPHLHAVLVPITSAPRTRRGREGTAKYAIDHSGNRLCADDIMRKANLVAYQDSYAAAMAPFGLARGVHGSKTRHQTMNEYYRKLQEERIPDAERSLASVEDDIKSKLIVSSDLDAEHKRKRKKIDKENGSAIRRGVANLFGKSVDDVVKERDKTIDDLKAQLADERKERRALKKQMIDMGKPLSDKQRQELQSRIDSLNESIKANNSEIKRLQDIIDDEPLRTAEAVNNAKNDVKQKSAAAIKAAQDDRDKYVRLYKQSQNELKMAKENTGKLIKSHYRVMWIESLINACRKIGLNDIATVADLIYNGAVKLVGWIDWLGIKLDEAVTMYVHTRETTESKTINSADGIKFDKVKTGERAELLVDDPKIGKGILADSWVAARTQMDAIERKGRGRHL